jgi:hypothetical protein
VCCVHEVSTNIDIGRIVLAALLLSCCHITFHANKRQTKHTIPKATLATRRFMPEVVLLKWAHTADLVWGVKLAWYRPLHRLS